MKNILSNIVADFLKIVRKPISGRENTTLRGWSEISHTTSAPIKEHQKEGRDQESPIHPLLMPYRNFNAFSERGTSFLALDSGENQFQTRLSQQQEIIDIILATQEEERKRIAEGLHNGLCQLLYAVKLKFESLGLPKGSGDPSNVPSQIESLLNEAIEQTRNISFELMPAILKDFGLEITLVELCKRFSQGNLRITCSYKVNHMLDTALKMAVFRMVQELVNNIIKHSRATVASIAIEQEDNYIHIKVKDNGKGFDPNLVHTASGIGISSIRNRVRLLEGEFTIVSKPDHGTEVILKIKKQ